MQQRIIDINLGKKNLRTNGTKRKESKTLIYYLHHINKKELSTTRSKTSCGRQIRTPENDAENTLAKNYCH